MFSKLQTKKFYIPAIIIVAVIIVIAICLISDRENFSKVAVIPIVGEIVSSPQYNDDGSIQKDITVSLDVVNKIQKADKERRIKAIVFLIDSSGGSSQGGEEVMRAIKEIKKPTVALIRSMGDSSAYWIASATGRIFAYDTSDVGSIGVTMSYVDNVNKNKTDGLTFNQLSYGKYKDMGNPDKSMTPDEKNLAIEQLNEFANIFIKSVAENRHLPIEKVQALADGSSMTASNALKNGLIDEIGSFPEANKYLSKILKTNVNIQIPSEKTEEEK